MKMLLTRRAATGSCQFEWLSKSDLGSSLDRAVVAAVEKEQICEFTLCLRSSSGSLRLRGMPVDSLPICPIFNRGLCVYVTGTNETNEDVDDTAELKTKCPAKMVRAMLDEL